jgi:hypothetical protein
VRGPNLAHRESKTGEVSPLAQQRDAAVRSIVDSFTAIYQALDEGTSTELLFKITPAPAQRLSDQGIEVTGDDVMTKLVSTWEELRSSLTQGNFDPVEVRAKIDSVIGDALNVAAA